MGSYEAVIGLEVHVQLATASKLFCSCPNKFGQNPNTNICEVCAGLPGALPVPNRQAVHYAVLVGLATNCAINQSSVFARKNYFYPDLPSGYQISQFDLPLCEHGHIDIVADGVSKRIGITRIHMEEDAGKLVHSGLTISTSDYSAVDYNRAGVPLIEIVSEPDMRSAAEARAYMEQLKAILEYTDVCDCKMQEGSLRCDANISVMPEDATEFGTRAEIKNLNSFRALERAIEYEVERQIEIVEDGGHVVQETRTWDDANGVTLSMRSKEEAHDYRYFPEPDLVPVNLDQAWIDEIKATLPELPSARKERLLAEDVPEDNADIIVASKKVADYFDAGTKATKNLKALSNWLIGDVAGFLNAEGIEIDDPEFRITPDHLGGLVNLIDKGVLSSKLAKQVFAEMLKENEAPEVLVKKLGLEQVSDAGELGKLVDEVIAANPQSIADFKAGKKKALGFLVGQIMKATHGKANPGMVNKMLMEKLQ